LLKATVLTSCRIMHARERGLCQYAFNVGGGHRVRLIRFFALGLALLLGQPALASDEARPPSCRGVNILEQMQGTDTYERILAAAAATENTEALLWKIEQGDRPPSYLFGTVHLTDDRISEHSPALLAALGQSRLLVLEIEDLSSGNFLKTFTRARELMMFSDRRRLDQMLNGEEFSKVVGILQRAGFPPELAGAFRPWVASLLMALSDCEQLRMRAGLLSLDAKLANQARSLGINVAGLETLELQLRAMASVPEADQMDILKAALRTYDRIDDILETTVQLYLARQIGIIWPLQLALAEQVGVTPEAFTSLEHSLLATRNLGMRESAVPHLAEGGAFIAVGALHLPGRHGLVSLLREAGYTVTAME
jgi:uncharacterized protein YbaP (TraB family)